VGVWDIITGIGVRHAVDELVEFSPRGAARLARWAARRQHADNALRACTRAQEYAFDVDACPGRLSKLAVGLAFAAKAVAASTRRAVARAWPGAGGTPGAMPVDRPAIEALDRELRRHDDIRALPRHDRKEFRALAEHLRTWLGQADVAFDEACAAQLVDTVAFASEVLVDDRDERTATHLICAAQRHAGGLGADQPAALRLRYAEGYATLQLGDAARAQHILEGLCSDVRRVCGADHVLAVKTSRLLAWALDQQGLASDAEAEFGDLLVRMSRIPDVSKTLRLHVCCMHAWTIRGCGRLAEAVQSYIVVVAERERVLGPDHPDTLDARHSLAKVRLEQGDTATARAELEHVLEARRRTLSATHPDTLETRKYAVLAREPTGRLSSARQRGQLRRVLAAQTKTLGAEHPNTADTRTRLAAMRRVPRG
jgi:hypothetical protein